MLKIKSLNPDVSFITDPKMKESLENDLKIFEECFPSDDETQNIDSIFIVNDYADMTEAEKILDDVMYSDKSFENDSFEYADEFENYFKLCYIIDDEGHGIIFCIKKELVDGTLLNHIRARNEVGEDY